jgi:hypothetical protein
MSFVFNSHEYSDKRDSTSRILLIAQDIKSFVSSVTFTKIAGLALDVLGRVIITVSDLTYVSGLTRRARCAREEANGSYG